MIESTFKYLRYNIWAGRYFSDPNDINGQCIEWLKKVNSQNHGTTHKIPMERLKLEKLNSISVVPAYMTRKEKMRKVSRESYVSYNGNHYSVPWKYAGRECPAIEESSHIRMGFDSQIVPDHELLQGTGRISRKKEHFEGLL